MAKFIIDITNSHPELKEAWKLFEELAYSRAYSQVFSDLIERMLSRQSVRFENEELVSKPFTPKQYKEEEIKLLDNIILSLEEEYKKRVWFRREKGDRSPSGWYDPLGALYVCPVGVIYDAARRAVAFWKKANKKLFVSYV